MMDMILQKKIHNTGEMNALSLNAHNTMTWASDEIFAVYANDSYAQISSKVQNIKWKNIVYAFPGINFSSLLHKFQYDRSY